MGEKQKSQQNRKTTIPQYMKAVSGSIGGIVEACCLQPIDIIKTRLHLDRSGTHLFFQVSEMDANKTQTWRITVRARAKSFGFKFKASRLLPSCRLFESRFSLWVNLRGFLFKVKSETADSELGHAGWPSMKSKFLRFVGKFWGQRAGKKVTSDPNILKFRHRENKSTTKHLINSSIVEDVAFLSHPITEKDLKGNSNSYLYVHN